MRVRLTRLLLLLGVMLVPAGGARAASIWTPLLSGTTQTISAIAIPKANEVVDVTTGGQIWYLNSGTTFVQASVTPSAPLGFSAVSMSPDGSHGVAVGKAGAIYVSDDSGHTWNKLAAQPLERTLACNSPGATLASLGDNLLSVHYADANTVYITGDNNDVLKSTNAGAAHASVTFAEVNKTTAVSCVANPGGSGQAFADTAWLDATHGYLLSNNFGAYFLTSDGFATATQVASMSVNGFQDTDKLAVDAADPTRAWATSSGAKNGSYFQYTVDGGSHWSTPTYDTNQNAFMDIADSGTTVVAVGTGGDIYTSANGVNFYRQIAPAYPSTDWDAVAFVPGTNTAFVGGAGGAMVVTTTANQLPDTTPPTGYITGPKSLAVGQFGGYVAHLADNPGGSGIDLTSVKWSVDSQTRSGLAVSFGFSTPGSHTIVLTFKDNAGNQSQATYTVNVTSAPTTSSPVSSSTGGATIVIFKRVTIHAASSRYIPVTIKCKKPRRFVIQLVTVKKKHKTLASLSTTLNHGSRTVHLKIGKSVHSGTYELVVTVYTTGKHPHRTGHSVKQVFVLS
jgi:photosystem II stability/assembly factor-like uncharacterized protein